MVGKHDSRRQRGYLAQHYTAEGMRELGVSEVCIPYVFVFV